MKQMSKWQSIVFAIGACMMVIGVGTYVLVEQVVSPWIFALGTIAFAAMQMCQTYSGQNMAIHRLCSIMMLGNVLFLLSGLLMIENAYRFLFPYFTENGISGYNAYLQYIHNNWVVVLLIAVVLEVYTTHRISNELAKEIKKS